MGPYEAFINLKKNSRLHFAIFFMLFKCLLLFLDYHSPKKKKKFMDVYGNWNSLR